MNSGNTISDNKPPLYFVCYPRSEGEAHLVERIEAKFAGAIRRSELTLWIDDRDLAYGSEFRPEIDDALHRASGAIVLVGDDFWASNYIQEHEWPNIEQRNAEDDFYTAFLLGCTRTAPTDPTLSSYTFINDPNDDQVGPLLHAEGFHRDRILTELLQAVSRHASLRSSGVSPRPSPRSAPFVGGSERLIPPIESVSAADLRPGLHNVPAPPSLEVPTPELDQLLDALRSRPHTAVTGLHGEGGTGKSVLAAAAARALVDQYPGGVHWTTIGEDASPEDVAARIDEVVASLGESERAPSPDANAARRRFAGALRTRPALVVVDDVWHPWQAQLLLVADPTDHGCVLATTRFEEVLPANAEAISMDRLDSQQSVQFLRATAGGLPNRQDDVAAVLQAANGLRLALAVIGASVRRDESWTPTIERLANLGRRFGLGDDASTAHKALFIASSGLDDSQRSRLWALGALPPDGATAISTAAILWDCDVAEAASFVQLLVSLDIATASDVHGTDGSLVLHDHVHDFVILEGDRLNTLDHLKIWRHGLGRRDPEEPRSWVHVAKADPALWDRLVWHGVRAGLNRAEPLSVVGDPEWLESRIATSGVRLTERDLREVARRYDLDSDHWLPRLERVLRHGGLFESATSESGLLPSLRCWLGHLETPSSDDVRGPNIAGSLPVPSPSLQETLRHAGQLFGVEFSPDGTRLATAGNDGTSRVWSPNGTVDCILEGHGGDVWDVAWSPDGTRLATASLDGTVRIWSADGTHLNSLEGHGSGVMSVAWSPDGTRLATASSDHTARIWSPDGTHHNTLEGHAYHVWGVAWSPDGTHLATASWDHTARIWSADGTHTRSLEGHTSPLFGTTWSPDGTQLATTCADGTVRIWSADGTIDQALEGHTNPVFAVEWSPDGSSLATAGGDGTARIWSAQGTDHVTLEGHTNPVTAVSWSSDGTRLATAGNDGTARIWSAGDAQQQPLSGHTSVVMGVAWAPDGTRLATASDDGTARIWSPDGTQTHTLEGHVNAVWDVSWSPSGSQLATAGLDRTARIWDSDGTHRHTLEGHTKSVTGLSWSPDGATLATASGDGTGRTWSPAGTHIQTFRGHTSDVMAIAWSPDGSRIATASTDMTARIWSPDGTHRHTLEGHTSPLMGLAWSPDGTRLATAGGLVRIWSADGDQLRTLDGHTSAVMGLAWSPDGSRLVTASLDGTARIWSSGGATMAVLALGVSGPADWYDSRLLLAAGRHWVALSVDELLGARKVGP